VYKIDPEAKHLAEEYRANTRGPHSPELQRVLNLMRGAPRAGKHILIFDKTRRRYMIAQLSGERGKPVLRSDDCVFALRAEAELAVFKLRWKQHTGRDLPD
jgi:hypothetical protein